MKLLFQKSVFGYENNESLLEEIFGKSNVIFFDDPNEIGQYTYDLDGSPIFLRSSVSAAHRIKRMFIGDHVNDFYDCNVWVPKLKSFYLNSEDYQFLDLDEIQKRFFHQSSDDITLFIRPIKGNKVFSGDIFWKDKLEKEIVHLRTLGREPEDIICLYSSSKIHQLEDEYRMIVVNNKCISSSQYMRNGNLHVDSKTPKYVNDFTHKVIELSDFLKYEVMDYVLDVVKLSDGQMKIVEINSIETSGYYDANLKKVYTAIANRNN